ncbi:putative transposase [Sphingobium indicum UT26S]|uniref:Putative transposase n=1 Tax=Sphingobium indicum (strain DSM 16413 / CCM 7287 / MTCC 6362 / UT26 / NBRC 101211 / UT26S) TaxID=452662 RepID=D4Z5H1_SPHIU|nr:putative transposase [Sphingobium indicum UT26S]
MAGQPGFFDLSDRYEALSVAGDPLERLPAVVDFELFQVRWWRRFGAIIGNEDYACDVHKLGQNQNENLCVHHEEPQNVSSVS